MPLLLAEIAQSFESAQAQDERPILMPVVLGKDSRFFAVATLKRSCECVFGFPDQVVEFRRRNKVRLVDFFRIARSERDQGNLVVLFQCLREYFE